MLSIHARQFVPCATQAIQHCRGNPPMDWPQEAYVLIGAAHGFAGVPVCDALTSRMLPAGRNDIAASMAAAEQQERPAEAALSSIVSTPLGKMAKTGSPTKKPLPRACYQQQQAGTPGEWAPPACSEPSGWLGIPCTRRLSDGMQVAHPQPSLPLPFRDLAR